MSRLLNHVRWCLQGHPVEFFSINLSFVYVIIIMMFVEGKDGDVGSNSDRDVMI